MKWMTDFICKDIMCKLNLLLDHAVVLTQRLRLFSCSPCDGDFSVPRSRWKKLRYHRFRSRATQSSFSFMTNRVYSIACVANELCLHSNRFQWSSRVQSCACVSIQSITLKQSSRAHKTKDFLDRLFSAFIKLRWVLWQKNEEARRVRTQRAL